MIRNDDTQVQVAALNKKITWQNVNAIAIALVPEPGNVGGYPVEVIINDDNANPLTVDGPAYFGDGKVINVLTVDVTKGGGKSGDKWRVEKQPTAEQSRRVRGLYDAQGRLHVHPSGGETLGRYEIAAAAMALGAGGVAASQIVLMPDGTVKASTGSADGIGGPQTAELWDLRKVNGARLSWLANGPVFTSATDYGTTADLLNVFVAIELYTAKPPANEGVVFPIRTVQGGNTSMAQEGLIVAKTTSFATIGAAASDAGSTWTELTTRANWARFVILKDAGALLAPYNRQVGVPGTDGDVACYATVEVF